MARKQKSGYYTRTITLPNGKRKYVYGATKAEADAKLEEVKRELAGGILVGDKTTFGELAELWFRTYKHPTVSESTARCIRSQVNKHILPTFAMYLVQDITPLMCQAWVSDLAENSQMCGQTLQRIRSNMAEILDVGVKNRLIASNPMNLVNAGKPQPREKREKEILSREFQEEILEQLPFASPEYLFFLIGCETGMRRGEILALAWDCIDLGEGIITVRRSLNYNLPKADGGLVVEDHPKTKAGFRTVPIPDSLNRVLAVLRGLPGSSEYLFGVQVKPGVLKCKLCPSSIYTRIKNVGNSIIPGSDVSPHLLRHTYISRLIEGGMTPKEVQLIAGHEDVSTTLGIYTHITQAQLQKRSFATARSILSPKPQQPEDAEGTAGGNVINFPQQGKEAVAK